MNLRSLAHLIIGISSLALLPAGDAFADNVRVCGYQRVHRLTAEEMSALQVELVKPVSIPCDDGGAIKVKGFGEGTKKSCALYARPDRHDSVVMKPKRLGFASVERATDDPRGFLIEFKKVPNRPRGSRLYLICESLQEREAELMTVQELADLVQDTFAFKFDSACGTVED